MILSNYFICRNLEIYINLILNCQALCPFCFCVPQRHATFNVDRIGRLGLPYTEVSEQF